MFFSRFSILFLAFTLILEFSTGEDRTCNKVLSEHNRQQVNNLGICSRKLNYKTGTEKIKKAMCIMKCTMERQGLINDNGSIRVEELQKYIEKNFPKSLQEQAARRFSSCLDTIPSTSQIADPKDDTCKEYEPFIKCVTKVYPQLCRAEAEQRPASPTSNNVPGGIVKQRYRPRNVIQDLMYIAAPETFYLESDR